MPEKKTKEELQAVRNKCNEEYRKRNLDKYRAWNLAAYYRNRDAILARRREQRALKKQQKIEEAAKSATSEQKEPTTV